MANQDYNVFSPTVWSPYINRFFKANLVAGNTFRDFSDNVTAGGQTIRIPHIDDNFSINDIPTTSGQITAQSINDTKTDLAINNWKHAALRFSDYQVAQVSNNYNLKRAYAEDMAYKVAAQLDSALLAQESNLSYTVANTTASQSTLTSTSLEQAFSILESNSVPRSQLSLIVHPRAYFGDIFKRQKYYDASQFGRPGLPSGSISELYGVPVVSTPQVPLVNGSLRNLLVHPEAITYALGNLEGGMPSGVRMQEREGENLRVTAVADIMYGVKSLRTKAGVVLPIKNDR